MKFSLISPCFESPVSFTIRTYNFTDRVLQRQGADRLAADSLLQPVVMGRDRVFVPSGCDDDIKIILESTLDQYSLPARRVLGLLYTPNAIDLFPFLDSRLLKVKFLGSPSCYLKLKMFFAGLFLSPGCAGRWISNINPTIRNNAVLLRVGDSVSDRKPLTLEM